LAIDPANPAFLMTAGYIADLAGQTKSAIDYDSSALASDSGAYPAANDLGVELARQHHDAAAAEALRKAVGARPDYALGWFNLGVLYARMGPVHLLASQGALGRAFALDPTLRDRARRLTIDANVYRTGLDLSKPLPPHWSFAQAQRHAPVAAVGLLTAVLLGLSLARASGRGAANDFADRWLESIAQFLQRIPVINRLRPPVWALAATVVAFLLPLAHHPSTGLTAAVAFGMAVLLIAVLAIRIRVAVARAAGMTTRQESWGPGVIFGLAMGAVGTPWAPLPVLRAPDKSRHAHLAAPLALSLLSAILFIESAWLKVPLTESLAIATLIMAASTLLPVSPLDGAKLGKGGLVAGAGVVTAAILVGIGVV
jgi:cellulose synthase operon protein C